ncbi:hypothetical protein BK645_10960 [Pseudomonas protegens]|nr:hypothetical protein BK645_10960 [Pseudomonas protegens]ROM37096.1 hypothetical protein BK646_19005 [Pseudomonas protegens]
MLEFRRERSLGMILHAKLLLLLRVSVLMVLLLFLSFRNENYLRVLEDCQKENHLTNSLFKSQKVSLLIF